MQGKHKARRPVFEERVADALLRKLFERGLVVVAQPKSPEARTCVKTRQMIVAS